MELDPYIESIHEQLEAAARSGGDEALEVARRLSAPLDASIRLALQDAIAAAVEEITVDLAPGSVELRLRGREPRFVVTLPPADPSTEDEADVTDPPLEDLAPRQDDEGGGTWRINVRMPEHLKPRIERAADGEGLSVNSWLVRAARARLDRSEHGGRRENRVPHGAQRYIGWAR
jgi:hypothetical protein